MSAGRAAAPGWGVTASRPKRQRSGIRDDVLRSLGLLLLLLAVLALALVIEAAWGYVAASIVAVVILALFASGYWPADRPREE